MNKVYLSLGSNMGDRKKYLKKAIDSLDKIDNIQLCKISSFYETPPWGKKDQNSFINICIEIDTSLQPLALLKKLNEIEQALNRQRSVRWGPRTIDIDILLFEDIITKSEQLTIPHPHIEERGFVIVPLYELNPNLMINGKRIEEIMKKLDISEIKELESDDR